MVVSSLVLSATQLYCLTPGWHCWSKLLYSEECYQTKAGFKVSLVDLVINSFILSERSNSLVEMLVLVHHSSMKLSAVSVDTVHFGSSCSMFDKLVTDFGDC